MGILLCREKKKKNYRGTKSPLFSSVHTGSRGRSGLSCERLEAKGIPGLKLAKPLGSTRTFLGIFQVSPRRFVFCIFLS